MLKFVMLKLYKKKRVKIMQTLQQVILNQLLNDEHFCIPEKFYVREQKILRAYGGTFVSSHLI